MLAARGDHALVDAMGAHADSLCVQGLCAWALGKLGAQIHFSAGGTAEPPQPAAPLALSAAMMRFADQRRRLQFIGCWALGAMLHRNASAAAAWGREEHDAVARAAVGAFGGDARAGSRGATARVLGARRAGGARPRAQARGRGGGRPPRDPRRPAPLPPALGGRGARR